MRLGGPGHGGCGAWCKSLHLAAADCRDQISDMSSPLDRIRFIVRYLVLANPDGGQEAARRGNALAREHLRLAQTRPHELHRALQPILTMLSQEITAGMVAGQLADGPADHLASYIYNMVSTSTYAGILTRDADALGALDREKMAESIWTFCSRGLAA